jgi:CheY-like chemotaxis protein
VLEPLRPGERSDGGREDGLGFGLTLARRFVELHGGRLRAQSEGPGRGSTFVVELPAGRLGASGVIVVEDDDETRALVEQLLRDQGLQPLAFPSAADAYAYLEQVPAELAPRAIVSDIGLPDEDGYSFIRRVHALYADRNALAPPALALTAFASDEARARALDAGFEAHLGKPFEPSELRTSVERLLQLSNRAAVP